MRHREQALAVSSLGCEPWALTLPKPYSPDRGELMIPILGSLDNRAPK